MKVVINKCYGGFSISPEAMELLAQKKGVTLYWFRSHIVGGKFVTTPVKGYKDVASVWETVAYTTPEPQDDAWFSARPDNRVDLDLIAVVEQLGERANGAHADLSIVEIPDDVEYTIQEYDGIEWVAEAHRTWS